VASVPAQSSFDVQLLFKPTGGRRHTEGVTLESQA
jgi:hypothetical protein